MKKSLVTGGAGFIGSHVAEQLLKRGHQIVVLDDLSGGFDENVPKGVEFVKGSILDVPLIESLFVKHKFDHVFHLAAYAAEGLSHFIRRFNYTNNVVGSINLINAAVNHDVKSFVFTSSIAVYGAGQTPLVESLTPQPEDPYGIAKLSIEQDLKAAHEMFGLNYIVFRPHNVYGERQNIADRYRNVVGIFMNQLLKGEPMSIFGDGEQLRAFTHVDDVAPIIAESVDVPEALNEIFNIGADVPFTVRTLADVIAKSLGVTPNIKHLDARNEVKFAYSDHTKIERVFGKREKVSLEQGIQAMSDWVRNHGARPSSIFEGIEVMKNLPPSWAAVARARG